MIECLMVLFYDCVCGLHIIWCICRSKHEMLSLPAFTTLEDFLAAFHPHCCIFANKAIWLVC